jgi:hypothetical protein
MVVFEPGKADEKSAAHPETHTSTTVHVELSITPSLIRLERRLRMKITTVSGKHQGKKTSGPNNTDEKTGFRA